MYGFSCIVIFLTEDKVERKMSGEEHNSETLLCKYCPGNIVTGYHERL